MLVLIARNCTKTFFDLQVQKHLFYILSGFEWKEFFFSSFGSNNLQKLKQNALAFGSQKKFCTVSSSQNQHSDSESVCFGKILPQKLEISKISSKTKTVNITFPSFFLVLFARIDCFQNLFKVILKKQSKRRIPLFACEI